MDDEKLEKEFDQYKRSFAWQILENNIVEGEDVNVTRADIENYFRDYFIKNYFGNFNADSVKEQVDKIVADSMKNQEYVKNAYDLLYDQKLVEVLRKKMNIVHKEGDFKAFIDEVSPKDGKKEEKNAEEKPKKATTKRKTAAKTEEPAAEAAPAEEKPKKTRAKSTKKTDKE
jgi:DNA-binding transcriptional regulator YhcF (GntR family)